MATVLTIPYHSHSLKNLINMGVLQSVLEWWEASGRCWKNLEDSMSFSICWYHLRTSLSIYFHQQNDREPQEISKNAQIPRTPGSFVLLLLLAAEAWSIHHKPTQRRPCGSSTRSKRVTLRRRGWLGMGLIGFWIFRSDIHSLEDYIIVTMLVWVHKSWDLNFRITNDNQMITNDN